MERILLLNRQWNKDDQLPWGTNVVLLHDALGRGMIGYPKPGRHVACIRVLGFSETMDAIRHLIDKGDNYMIIQEFIRRTSVPQRLNYTDTLEEDNV